MWHSWFRHLDNPEHPRLNVEEEMTVKRPWPWGIRSDGHGHPLSRLDDDGVLAWQILARAIFHMHPHPVQMDRMFHHCVVHKGQSHPLAIVKANPVSYTHLTLPT